MKRKRINWRIATIFTVVIFLLVLIGLRDLQTETVTVKIKNKMCQELVSGSKEDISTEYRYLVSTDKEVFKIEKSLIHGVFSSSDRYLLLDTGKTYALVVCGIGKGVFSDYRNIVRIREQVTEK
jgi:predicted transcriptional regulator